jgi:hypothetical protein
MTVTPPWEYKEQPNDNEMVESPWFYASTYKEFQEGLKVVLNELSKYFHLIKELEFKFSPYEQEIEMLTTMIEWGKEKLQKSTSDLDTIVLTDVTYGVLRYLKAGMLLRIKYLIDRRSELLVTSKYVPNSILKSFDDKIQQLQNLAEQGALNGLRPAEIFFEVILQIGETPASPHPMEPILRSPVTGAEYVLKDIPIIDPVLRERCLIILRQIRETGKEEPLGAVIRDMNVILEDRIRGLSKQTEKLTGAELITVAMKKEPVRIMFSHENDIQDSAYMLFRGYSDFIRNEVMHKLATGYTYERVIQLISIVDYLLFILGKADIRDEDG